MHAGPEDSFNGLLAQLVRASVSYTECPRFESEKAHHLTQQSTKEITMVIINNIKTGIVNALKDPLGACFGAAWWILCLGLGAWVLQGVLGFVFQINGLN
tara:strand:+ start:237 stop:536 length:300 start_codon:yes stop_codon:yes gene_type:complete